MKALSLPDSPTSAIEFTLTFLPGFLALGLCVYITDIALSDFAFTYVAIAISILIYFVVAGAVLLVRRLRRVPPGHPVKLGVRVAVVAMTTMVAGIGFTLLYESQIVIQAVRSIAPSIVLKFSQRQPLAGLIASDANQTLHHVDGRPVDHRLAVSPTQTIAPFNLYMRVSIRATEVYEGRPMRFATGKSETAFPLVLSPACRVTTGSSGGPERFGRIFGPGVLITGHDLKAIELFEHKASQCWRCFQLDKGVSDPQCFDVAAVSRIEQKGPKP